jgi:mevalonate kinase
LQTYHSNGKLLITSEYTVLDGALALAVPTKFGQELKVEHNNNNCIDWKSISETDDVWFEAHFKLKNKQWYPSVNNEVATTLGKILNAINGLNPEVFQQEIGFNIESKLNFNRHWGLGSSSTLINNLANWAKVDAYQLLKKTFGGSGYDIACAAHNTPITYQLTNSQRIVTPVDLNWPFKDQLYFVYLNKKQNSRHAIAHYKDQAKYNSTYIQEISELTHQLIGCTNPQEFDIIIERHENLLSALLNLKPVKQELFSDFLGSIKSLGAWGGDFIMARASQNPTAYFKAKGFDIVIPFSDMVN